MDDIIKLEVFSSKCVLMRNGLSKEEQISLVKYVRDNDRSQFYMAFANNPKAQAMAQIRSKVPSQQARSNGDDCEPAEEKNKSSTETKQPQTNFRFVFENNNPYISLNTNDDASIFNQLVKRLNDDLRSSPEGEKKLIDVPPIPGSARAEVGVQGYKSPNGSLGRHTDRDDSLVYLMSLGCTARFLVKTPEMEEDSVIDFNSGDVLYFDASPNAHVEHAVLGVDAPSTSPTDVVATLGYLANHRIGIQYRLYPNLD